jgi:hypothetical protein
MTGAQTTAIELDLIQPRVPQFARRIQKSDGNTAIGLRFRWVAINQHLCRDDLQERYRGAELLIPEQLGQ